MIDDLITYYLRRDCFPLVVNAATRDKDLAWMRQQAEPFDVTVIEQADLAMIAVQGPQARQLGRAAAGADAACRAALAVKPFNAIALRATGSWRAPATPVRTGLRWSCPPPMPSGSGSRLLAAGVKPCGLGARDTLRLEAGMNLYGQDMDETGHAAGVRAGLDRGHGRTSAILLAGRARSSNLPPAWPANWLGWCWKAAGCCVMASG